MTSNSSPLVYLITGANKGLGYEAVRILAERLKDQAIVLLGTRSLENGKTALAKLQQSNPSFDYANVELLQIDVSKPASIQAAADFVKSKYGTVHVLINNAGIMGSPAEGADTCFKVNVDGVYDTLTAFHPLLVPNQSSNIVVGSTTGAWALFYMNPDLEAIFNDFNKFDITTARSLANNWLAETNGKSSKYTWPDRTATAGPYAVSKAIIMALTRKWALDHPEVKTIIMCPSYCATDLNDHQGVLTAAQGGEGILFPVFHPEATVTGGFYRDGATQPFKSDPAEFAATLSQYQ